MKNKHGTIRNLCSIHWHHLQTFEILWDYPFNFSLLYAVIYVKKIKWSLLVLAQDCWELLRPPGSQEGKRRGTHVVKMNGLRGAGSSFLSSEG